MKDLTPKDFIARFGIPLDQIGLRELALGKAESLSLLCLLEQHDVPVLGGDVYCVNDGAVEHTFDDWHCDQRADEADKSYVRRSVEEARRYIQNYKLRVNGDAIFVVVAKMKLF